MLTFHSRKVGGGHPKRFRVVASNCIMCRYKHVCGDNPMLVKGCFYCLEVLCGSY